MAVHQCMCQVEITGKTLLFDSFEKGAEYVVIWHLEDTLMTDAEILLFAASMNYAHIDIDSSCCIRCGCEQWYQTMPNLNADQREKLIAKIERWHELVRKEQVRS